MSERELRRAAFTGSFDPPTFGHIDIIERASTLFDELVVVIAHNNEKRYLFSVEERITLLGEIIKDYKNTSIEVCPKDELLADFLRKKNIRVIVRGARDGIDFVKEAEMARINKTARKDIETVFLPAAPALSFVSSSTVRTLASYNGDVSYYVPEFIARALKDKMKTKRGDAL